MSFQLSAGFWGNEVLFFWKFHALIVIALSGPHMWGPQL